MTNLELENGRCRKIVNGAGSRVNCKECLRQRVHRLRLIEPGAAIAGVQKGFVRGYE